MTRTVVITSGKGGVGKTNISVNAALELARLNYKTCLFDADLGLANVNILLGINPKCTLDDFVFNGTPLDDVVHETDFGFSIIPGSSGIEKIANLAQGKIANLIGAFKRLSGFDFFLIDTSSGISTNVISFCLAASETILVLTSEPTSLTDAYAILKVLASRGYKGTVNILVNKGESVPQSKNTYLNFKAVVDKHLEIHINPLGMVLNDPRVEEAIVKQRPLLSLYPDTISSQCIRALVSNLVNSRTKEGSADIGVFWSSFFELIHDELDTERQNQSHPVSQSDHGIDRSRHVTSAGGQAFHQRQLVTALDSLLLTEGLLADKFFPSPLPLMSFALHLQNSGQLDGTLLTQIFSSDPALMGKLLKLFLGRPTGKFERNFDVANIIQQLGKDQVSALLINTAIQSSLSEKQLAEYNFINSFWYHSCFCGILAKSLAEQIRYPFPAEAFLSGFLHDIGRLALQVHSPEIYFVSPFSYEHSREILTSEIENCGHSHAELGAMILQRWNCNPLVVDAVKHHDESPDKIATAFDLTKLVYVAQRLCSAALENGPASELGASLLQLAPQIIATLRRRAREQTGDLARTFAIPVEEAELTDEEKRLNKLKQQALDYTIYSGLLPRSVAVASHDGVIRQIHQGARLLFGINRIICLFPDKSGMYLKADSFSEYYESEFLANIIFPLSSKKNLIVRAFSQVELFIVAEDELTTLAEKQLLALLQSRRLLCVPLGGNGLYEGVMLAGIGESDHERLKGLQGRLLQFGVQAASSLSLRNH